MSKDQVIALLDKYLKDECSEEEHQRVMLWLQRMDNHSGQWNSLSEAAKRDYIKKLYADLSNKTTNGSGGKVHKSKYLVWAVAASLLAVAVLGILYTTLFRAEEVHEVEYSKVSTGIGEMKTITLADGTKVWMNAMSSLRYPGHFGAGKRMVYLEGEAFFEVAKDQNSPFIVHSGKLHTKVLGTSFDISAYPDDKAIEVTVASGKVAVHSDNRTQTVILNKNEAVRYKNEGTLLTKYTVRNIGDAFAWKKHQLAFFHTPMREVVSAFYRAFGIKINFGDKAIGDYELSGHFDTKQKPENILKAICLSIGGKYIKKGNDFLIKKL